MPLSFDDILLKYKQPPEENIAQIPKKYSTLEFVKEHPIKAIFQPVSKTLGKSTVKEIIEKKVKENIDKQANLTGKTNWLKDFAKSYYSGVAGDIADIAQTPATYTPDIMGKVVGKIPIGGTTLGRIASTIPIGKGFAKGVSELSKYETALANLPARVVASRAPLEGQGSVYKVIDALKKAGPVRAEQEALYSATRTARAGKIKAIGETNYGEQGFYKQLGALRGELPKAQFQGIRDQVTQFDVDDLFNAVEKNSLLQPYDKITAKNGLAKLLGEGGGVVPTEGELKLLKEVFPEELIVTALSKRPLLQKVGEGVAQVLNVPRAIMASFDMSAPFRQGIFLVSKPKQFAGAFKDMFKYFFNEKAYQGLLDDIKARPTFSLMQEAKLPITDIGRSLTSREEAFMSNLAERIPGIGKIVRASNRAYSGFLNKLRADVFDDFVAKSQSLGVQPSGKLLRDMGDFIGAATGRGGLGKLESAAVPLNTMLFSPRLMMSRLSLLNPYYYAKLSPPVRKEALKSLFTFASLGTSVLGLAKLGGAKVETDPRSADFGKIRIGDTRYDIWGGFQQYIRIAAQLIYGETISSTTGVKTTVGEGYKPITRLDILQRFIEAKEAPVMSFITNLLKGRTFLGKSIDIKSEIGQRFVPIILQDMVDLYTEQGPKGILMASPAIFGLGTQTYKPTASGVVFSMKSVQNQAKELIKQGRTEEAKRLVLKNKQLLMMGQELRPYQDAINDYTKAKKELSKTILIPRKDIKSKTALADRRIKKLEEIMDTKYLELLKKYAIQTTK